MTGQASAESPAPRLLLLRPGALGDTLLTVDALLALRRRFPNHLIEFCGNRPAALLLAEWGLIDRASSFDSPEVAQLYRAPPRVPGRWERTETAILWLGPPGPVADAFRDAGVPTVLAARPLAEDPSIHVADHLLGTLAPLGIARGVPADALWSAHPQPAAHSGGVILHAGSGSPRKNWPTDRFASLLRRLLADGEPVCVLDGPADGAATTALLRLARAAGAEPRTSEPTDLSSLSDLLRGHSAYVGNDSGVSHLSARLGVPTVAVFGPTHPRQWRPRGPRVVALTGDIWPTTDAVYTALTGLIGCPS